MSTTTEADVLNAALYLVNVIRDASSQALITASVILRNHSPEFTDQQRRLCVALADVLRTEVES